MRGKAGEGSIVGAQPGKAPNYAEMEALNQALTQEIIDRLAGDLTAANDAIAAARTYTDDQVKALNGILEDIVGADDWAAGREYPAGDFVRLDGQLYRALVQNIDVVPGTAPATWQEIGDYRSVGDALAAAISMSTQNTSDILAESVRLDGVVARMPAGTGGLATDASVSSLTQATADGFSAMGQRVGVVEAKLPDLATNASVSAVQQALVDADGALGRRIDQTEASLAGKASAGSLQEVSSRVEEVNGRVDATASDINQVRASISAAGGNRVPNSGFNAPLTTWGILSDSWGGTAGPYVNGYGAAWHPPGINCINFDRQGTPPAGANVIIGGPVVPVNAGERWMLSAYLAGHRCRARVHLIFTDANYNTIGPQYPGSPVHAFGGTDLRNWGRSVAVGVVPEGAVIANLWLVFDEPTGEPTPVMWMVRPMFEQATPTQNQPSPWQESADGVEGRSAAATQILETRATQLENGQTRLEAKAGVMLDVNNRVIGWRANNDGAEGIFDIVADHLNVTDPHGTGSTTFESGRWVTRSGGYMQVHGKPFGTTGDLMMYIGVGSDPNAASKGNGIFWIDNKGNAYFGGSLSAGVLRNAVQTGTTQTTGTELLNGPFRTNGNNRTITLSFTRTHRRQRSASGSAGFVAGGGSNTAQVQLFRQIGTGSWVLWQILSVTGSVDIANEPDGPDIAISGWGGSFTVNDGSSPLETVSYRAVVTAFTEQSVTHQTGSFDSQTITQNLSIISVEQ